MKAETSLSKERRHALVGDSKLWKMKREFQIQFLKNMGLQPEHYLFDIGCGTLRGGIPLIDYLQEGRYFGVEVRAKALAEGLKELDESGFELKKPTLLLSSDVSQINIKREFDFIWAFSVLIHINDVILENTITFVSQHLSEKGIFYANVNIGETADGHWQGFPVVTRPFEFYEQMCSKNNLVVSDIGSLKDIGHISNRKLQDAQKMLKITKK